MFCSGATWIICVVSTVRSFDPTRVFRLCSIVCLKRTLFLQGWFLIVPRHVEFPCPIEHVFTLNFRVPLSTFLRVPLSTFLTASWWLCDSMFKCYNSENSFITCSRCVWWAVRLERVLRDRKEGPAGTVPYFTIFYSADFSCLRVQLMPFLCT